MNRLLLAVFLLFASLPALAQTGPGPGGLGISVVTDGSGHSISGTRQMAFTCGATVSSAGAGTGIVNVNSDFTPSVTATANLTITSGACGTLYNNVGATGAVIFTLPPAAAGLWYGFTVDAAQTVEVLGNGTDQIAIGASNSSSENVTNATPYGSLMIYAYKAGQWVALSSTGTWVVH